MFIFPEYASSDLLMSIAMLDAPEFWTGDTPHHCKSENPHLRKELHEAEDHRMNSMMLNFPHQIILDEDEKKVLKILDLLESWAFQSIIAPSVADNDQPLPMALLNIIATFESSEIFEKRVLGFMNACKQNRNKRSL